MNDLSRAEEALTEANHLDTKNPDVWAYLSLMCLKVERQKKITPHTPEFSSHILCILKLKIEPGLAVNLK